MYNILNPAPELSPYIQNYWYLKPSRDEVVDLSVDVYVDARADLVFNFGASYSRQVGPSQPVECTHSNLDFQRKFPIKIRQKGAVEIVGVRFHTGGLAPFLAEPAGKFTNLTPPPAQVLGKEAEQVEKSLKESLDHPVHISELLDDFFLSRFQFSANIKTFFDWKCQVENSVGEKHLSELFEGMTTYRQIDRLFYRYFGLSPKFYSRVIRFQKTLEIMRRGTPRSFGDLFAKLGYYDQPHLVKEFKTFAGGIPKDFIGYFPSTLPTDFAPNRVQFLQD